MYVEDEVNLAKITADMLVRHGFRVKCADNGHAGLEAFGAAHYDICIVDIMLPGLDGYSLVRKIRERDPDVPVIFLTARSLAEDVVKGFESGGNDYLRKPFNIEELVARMNALLNRFLKVQPAKQETVFGIGSYTFDYSLMRLCGNGADITLTHLENELLHRLILNKNNVLPRKNVLLELWGNDTFFNARSMDVYISKLRKHLAADALLSIVNIRGIGYKLIVRD